MWKHAILYVTPGSDKSSSQTSDLKGFVGTVYPRNLSLSI